MDSDLLKLLIHGLERSDKQLVRLSPYGDQDTIHTMYEVRALLHLAKDAYAKQRRD